MFDPNQGATRFNPDSQSHSTPKQCKTHGCMRPVVLGLVYCHTCAAVEATQAEIEEARLRTAEPVRPGGGDIPL